MRLQKVIVYVIETRLSSYTELSLRNAI